MLVYLPATFSPLKKYHVCIAGDGRDYFQLGRIGRFADELTDDLIIIGIPYKNIDDRRSKYHPDSELQKSYIRFLAHELVPFIDREFPTFEIGASRTLIGDSLAATVSLMAALDYPHTFGKVIMQSPFVNETVLERVTNSTLTELQLYHIIGKEETEVKTTDGFIKDFLTPNRQLSKILEQKNIPYFYEEFDGNHTWRYWQQDLKRALSFIFQ